MTFVIIHPKENKKERKGTFYRTPRFDIYLYECAYV